MAHANINGNEWDVAAAKESLASITLVLNTPMPAADLKKCIIKELHIAFISACNGVPSENKLKQMTENSRQFCLKLKLVETRSFSADKATQNSPMSTY